MGYSQKNTIPSKERRLIQGSFQNYGLVQKIMENKKSQEENFQSVHKKNKGYD